MLNFDSVQQSRIEDHIHNTLDAMRDNFASTCDKINNIVEELAEEISEAIITTEEIIQESIANKYEEDEDSPFT